MSVFKASIDILLNDFGLEKIMGVGGIGVWQLLIILVIVLLLFGTKRLKNIGSDLGGAVKGFKGAMNKEEDKKKIEDKDKEKQNKVIEGEVTEDKDKDKDKDKI